MQPSDIDHCYATKLVSTCSIFFELPPFSSRLFFTRSIYYSMEYFPCCGGTFGCSSQVMIIKHLPELTTHRWPGLCYSLSFLLCSIYYQLLGLHMPILRFSTGIHSRCAGGIDCFKGRCANTMSCVIDS